VTDTTVVVANYRTQLEAEVAAQTLEASGIRCVIRSGEGAYYGPMAAGADLLVLREDADRAALALKGHVGSPR
jgi:hypothetical protein